MNRKISFSITVILLTSVIAGVAVYYNGALNSKNSKINSQNNEIANENGEIANLTSQVTNLKSQLANVTAQLSNLNSKLANLPSANLVGHLLIFDNPKNLTGTTAMLTISGSVTNIGEVTAYNAGLHVVAYDVYGTLQINATVPLAYEETFSNPFGTSTTGGGIGGSYEVTILQSGDSAQILLNIYHGGNTVTIWTVTPVWTNTP